MTIPIPVFILLVLSHTWVASSAGRAAPRGGDEGVRIAADWSICLPPSPHRALVRAASDLQGFVNPRHCLELKITETVGAAVGDRMDAADKKQQSQAAQKAFETTPSGQNVAWRNPDTGNNGTVTTIRTYQSPAGQYCREYQQTITVGGQKQEAYGTTCRQPDGSWKIMS